MRGDVRAGARGRRRRGDAHPRRRRRRVLPRLPLPQGLDAERAARRPRPAAHAARAPRRPARARSSWDEAFAEVERRLRRDRRRRTAATPSRVYIGNPTAHNLGRPLYDPRCSQGARHEERLLRLHRRPDAEARGRAGSMFGTALAFRSPTSTAPTSCCCSAPTRSSSNGSLADRARLARAPRRDPRARGGRIVVVDPRRTRTAAEADEHVPSGPAPTPHLLAGIAHVAVRRGPGRPRAARASSSTGSTASSRRSRALHPGAGRGRRCGIAAETIRRARPRARRRADAPRSTGGSARARSAFGTLACWLVDVLNVAHRQPRPPRRRDVPAPARGARTPRRAGPRRGVPHRAAGTAACAGCPRCFGELPVALPGRGDRDARATGQVRALITIAGNPVLSTPDAGATRRRARARWSSWSASTST